MDLFLFRVCPVRLCLVFAIFVSVRFNCTCIYVHVCVYARVCVSACQYDMVGPEGIVESHQITKDGKAGAAEAIDCKWYIRAPPRSKVSMRKSHIHSRLTVNEVSRYSLE